MPPLVQYFKIPASQQRKQFLKQLGAKSQLLMKLSKIETRIKTLCSS